MKTIGGLFGRSAFGPLYEHILKANDCANMLKSAVEKFIKKDYKGLAEIVARVSKLEHDADIIKEGIRESLSRSIFTAVNRNSILDLLKEQEAIADSCEDLAKLISVRETEVPGELEKNLVELTAKVIETVSIVCEASKGLCVASESDPSAHAAEKIMDIAEKVSRAEWETDNLQFVFIQKLFKIEQKIDPVSVIFLMNIARQLGAIADHAENVGDSLKRTIGG